jgi:CRISPR system Cascade subunit CasA
MLVSQIAADPVVALAAPRPDFDGALQEFLIGLLTVALQPADEAAWRVLWNAPPSSEQLQAALDTLPPAFDLDGDGPRFFQDLSAADFIDVEPGPIEQLLIDTPGEQTTRLNKDLFVKRSRMERLGRPAAAMALLTMQTYAPSGGQGHRTSLRGGGPLTTLVDPRVDDGVQSRAHEQPLWRKLWANVQTRAQWATHAPLDAPASLSAAFPWLAPTRTSGKNGGTATTPADAHPLQAYFGLPRRIRLEFDAPGGCDLTGRHDDRTVTGFRMRTYGVQYANWKHPLSPYYRTKIGEIPLPVHGQPGGVAWRDWLGLALRVPDGVLREPASAVASFASRGPTINLNEIRLHVFGYDMDNMKARGWTDALLPAFTVADERQELLYNTATNLTDAAGMAATALHGAVKTALFQSAENASGDFGQVRLDLWAATERAFYDAMATIATPALTPEAAEDEAAARRRSFATVLMTGAAKVFDQWCPPDGLAAEAMRRRVAARYSLITTLRGYSTLGERIFLSLGIGPPGGGKAARAAAKTRSPKEVRK